METVLDPRQAMVACIDWWRRSIIDCDDAGLPDRVRDIESMSRMLHSVMLDAVAELESRNIAVTAGFRNTKQLLSGRLNLSATEAGARVTHAGMLGPRRALGGEALEFGCFAGRPSGDWPAIIDRGTWAEVQDPSAYRASAHAYRSSRFYVLRGLVVCKKCGTHMSGSPGAGRRRICVLVATNWARRGVPGAFMPRCSKRSSPTPPFSC